MVTWTFQAATEASNWAFNVTVTNGSTLSMPYSSNVHAGDLLLLNLSTAGAFTWALSDTQGNAWFQVSPFVDRGDGYKGSMWWAVARTSGANTVNAKNISGTSATSLAWEIVSFSPPSGIPFIDRTATATGNSTTPEVSVPVIVGGSELVVAGIVPFGGATSVLAGFSATNSFGGNNNPMVYATEGSVGTYLPGVNHPTNIWGAIGISFRYTQPQIDPNIRRRIQEAALFTGREFDFFITLEKVWPLS